PAWHFSGNLERRKKSPTRSPSVVKSHSFRELTMAWPLVFLALLSYCAGVTSQPSLTQPASESVSPGETAKLSCTRNGGSGWDAFHWYQQKPGQAPRFLWYGTSTRGDGIPDRFTPSSSGNTGYLSITNIQTEDEAVYYCSDWEYNILKGYHSVFGINGYLPPQTPQTPAPHRLACTPPAEDLRNQR
ncbi:immunoglobulin lambda-1 light chain-like isoform X1, partial [Podarcis lilfordi]